MSEIDLRDFRNLVNDTNMQQYTSNIDFMLPNGFTQIVADDPHIRLQASDNNGFRLLVYVTEPIAQYDTLDTCIERDKMNVLLALHDVCVPGCDIPPFSLGKLEFTFLFKLYLQDAILPGEGGMKVFRRQITAYFVDPKTRCFYQVGLTSPGISYPLMANMVEGRITQHPDPLTASMIETMHRILVNITYRSDTASGMKRAL